MDFLLKLFDLFNSAAKNLSAYIPQSGPEAIELFKKIMPISNDINFWLTKNIGVNLQAWLAPLGKLVFIAANFLLETVKAIVAKL